MRKPTEAALAKMIARRVKRGESLDKIARTSGVSYSKLRAIARQARIRYRNQRPTQDQIDTAISLIMDGGATFRAAAAISAMSRTAVHRLITKLRARNLQSAGEMQFQDGAAQYSPSKRQWRCAIHGAVRIWPCVACAAESARRGTA